MFAEFKPTRLIAGLQKWSGKPNCNHPIAVECDSLAITAPHVRATQIRSKAVDGCANSSLYHFFGVFENPVSIGLHRKLFMKLIFPLLHKLMRACFDEGKLALFVPGTLALAFQVEGIRVGVVAAVLIGIRTDHNSPTASREMGHFGAKIIGHLNQIASMELLSAHSQFSPKALELAIAKSTA